MPKHMNRAQLPEVIATLAELEVHKLSLDDAFIEASIPFASTTGRSLR